MSKYVIIVFLLLTSCQGKEYTNECKMKRGDLTVDKFTNDTLYVMSWYRNSDNIIFRDKGNNEVRLNCDEFIKIKANE